MSLAGFRRTLFNYAVHPIVYIPIFFQHPRNQCAPIIKIWKNEKRYYISIYLKSVHDPLTLMHYLHLQQPDSSEIDTYYQRKLS